MLSKVPLSRSLEVSELVEVADRFGNVRKTPGEWRAVTVAGWAVARVEESTGDSVARTVDQLDIFSPVAFDAQALVRLPDGSQWSVQGHAEDYRHGPWWDPGLVVVHARRVEG